MIQYRCDLNDHLEHSRPPQFRFFSSEDFILNPNLVYRRNGGVPPLFADRIMVPGELDCSGPTVWAEDPFT